METKINGIISEIKRTRSAKGNLKTFYRINDVNYYLSKKEQDIEIRKEMIDNINVWFMNGEKVEVEFEVIKGIYGYNEIIEIKLSETKKDSKGKKSIFDRIKK